MGSLEEREGGSVGLVKEKKIYLTYEQKYEQTSVCKWKPLPRTAKPLRLPGKDFREINMSTRGFSFAVSVAIFPLLGFQG